MSERHWVIVINERTDECRFMQLAEEWLTFKYNQLEDIQPGWHQIGFYETRYEAYSAFIDL
jgi:hypothetical protein